MNRETIINELKKTQDIDPDKYDGSYELVREIVKSYASMTDHSKLTTKDLDAIYGMAIGSWKMSIDKKKEYINSGHLPQKEKDRLYTLLDHIWAKTCDNQYQLHEVLGKSSIGMSGTGFYRFRTLDDKAKQFIELLISLLNTNEKQSLELCDHLFKQDISGIGAPAASIILHCLKPDVFPILNNNQGMENIYMYLGIQLDHPKLLNTYIKNTRIIKEFRDQNFKFKNYRILDLMTGKINENNEDEDNKENITMEQSKYSKNMILYGPPGTGKTYNAINYAVAIIENKDITTIQQEEYEVIKNRYDYYLKNNKIAFTTFHQSYGYEEFIEGIKPVIDEKGHVSYEIQDGIFKEFVEQSKAIQESQDYTLNDDPVIWKMSLNVKDYPALKDECFKEGNIRLGWDEYGEDLTNVTEYSEGGGIVLNTFNNKMKIGDLVLSCYNASLIDGIGVIVSDVEWHPEYSKYKRVRKVKWLVKYIKENVLAINNNNKLVAPTTYKLNMKVEDVLAIVEKYKVNEPRYVFIIDEINRGNISKIFGELITLIEESKREGSVEELTAALPYSKEQFSIPDNIYILGTMNTADRSIALMDTALRRRFNFIEMMPESSLLQNINVEGVNIAKMLEIMNKRITYLYDREHTIGHAFFMPLKDDPTLYCLSSIFKNKIIPLLQEYFYDDYEKIQLVLGDNGKEDLYKFILDEKIKTESIFYGDVDDLLDLPEKSYRINEKAFSQINSYKKIIL